MTKAIIFSLLFLGMAYCCQAHIPDTAMGFFDNDAAEDTLYYHYANDPVDGSVYHLHLNCGSGKTYDFTVGVGFESMQISYWKRGWITTYQLKGGNMGFEIRTLYRYNARYDDWLEIKETVVAPRERTEISRPDVPTGISGRAYPPARKHKPRNK